jgi:hypothetical protein
MGLNKAQYDVKTAVDYLSTIVDPDDVLGEHSIDKLRIFLDGAERAMQSRYLPFLKLYTYTYMKFLIYYDQLPDNPKATAQKELNKVLHRDFDELVEQFTEHMNMKLLEGAIKSGNAKPASEYNTEEVKKNISAQAAKAFLSSISTRNNTPRKQEQARLLKEIMRDDEKDGLYGDNN